MNEFSDGDVLLRRYRGEAFPKRSSAYLGCDDADLVLSPREF